MELPSFLILGIVFAFLPYSSAFAFQGSTPALTRPPTVAFASPSSSIMGDDLLNSAFVFVKPHADIPKVQDKVREMLLDKKIEILSEGDIAGTTIDEKKLIDQHYYAIASKATLLDSGDIAVPPEKFLEFFGESWEDVLASNKAANAMQACEKLGVDAAGLEELWRVCEPKNKVVKFGGGFYCGLIEMEGKDPLYVFNAFFMNMRGRFTGADCSIHYFEVQWKTSDLSWEDFRGKVLGPTDPAAAPEGAIRKFIFDNWEDLGLAAAPNKGDNGVHASASPFEGLAEKMNWLGKDMEIDTFGSALLKTGISAETIKAWSVDPRVELPEGEGMGSIFDALEDMDASPCLDKCIAINAAS
eukprot:scaffold119746_cov48-Attheya_sp.AAC.1